MGESKMATAAMLGRRSVLKSSKNACMLISPTRNYWWEKFGLYLKPESEYPKDLDLKWRKGPWKYIFWLPYKKSPDPLHGVRYRKTTSLSQSRDVWSGEWRMMIIWWYMWFFIFTETKHLLGEMWKGGDKKWIDPSTYTDEEL